MAVAWWLRALAAVSLCCALAMAATAAEEEPIEQPNPVGATEGFLAGNAAGMLTLALRPAADQMPVVIVLSEEAAGLLRAGRYIDQLLGAGIAALLLEVDAGDQATLLLHAAMALARDGRFVPGQIGVIGFGQTGLAAAAARFPFAARALLYPGCGELAAAPAEFWAGRQVLLMHGTEDPANPLAACASAADGLGAVGAEVRHVQHRHAGYAWDWPRFGSERRVRLVAPGMAERVSVTAWPEMAELTAGQVAGFFFQAFRGAGE